MRGRILRALYRCGGVVFICRDFYVYGRDGTGYRLILGVILAIGVVTSWTLDRENR